MSEDGDVKAQNSLPTNGASSPKGAGVAASAGAAHDSKPLGGSQLHHISTAWTGQQHDADSSQDKAQDASGEAQQEDVLGQPKAAPSPAMQHRRRVVLRVEVATRGQARLLTYSMWVVNLLFIGVAATLLSSRETDTRVGDLRPYYIGELAIGAVCLAVHLALIPWFIVSLRRARRERRTWSKRQAYFARTAGLVLALQVPYSATFVAAFGIILSSTNCEYPLRVLSVLDFVQWLFFASLIMLMLARLHNMTLWRRAGALDMKPDFRLMLDRPAQEALLNHRAILLLWLALVSVSLAAMVEELVGYDETGATLRFAGGCDALLDEWSCNISVTQIVVAVLSFVLVLVYCGFWGYWMRRALKDHEQLPYSRYRSTLIFVRVQLRVVTPVLIAVVVSLLFLTLIPSLRDSCWAAVDAQLGNLPIDLALTASTAVFVILYMPKAAALDSPLLQEFLQTFTWTAAGAAAAVEERNQLLLETEALPEPEKQEHQPDGGVASVVGHLQEELAAGLAKLTGAPDLAAAAEQLRQEPMFCVETAVKLFYWMRLAYRDEDALTHPFVNANVALPLFDLDHFEMIWDDSTDTHAVLGWNSAQAVIAFRGTQSMQNVMTDLKLWRTPLQPRRRHNGRLVKVHAGFHEAWVHAGFNRKVLARLLELDAGPQPLRFWVAGHSLGGALAALAAPEIQRQHPRSRLSVYLYGCPKVGNRAFAAEFDAAVPDTWSVINGLDPIPRMPGFGFNRVGKRVSINPKGDLILRPTFFEVSVIQRGTSAKHHMTGSYALSLAAVLRAQFNPSKALPGGPEGVAALTAAVDLRKCLVLSNVELASLASPAPEHRPVLLEVLAARAAAAKRQRRVTVARLASSVGRTGGRLLPRGCGALAPLCGGRAGGGRRPSSEASGEASAEVAGEGAGVASDSDSQLPSWSLSEGEVATGEATAARPPRRSGLDGTSLHTRRYPTFRLERDGEGGAASPDGEEGGSSVQPGGQGAGGQPVDAAADAAAGVRGASSPPGQPASSTGRHELQAVAAVSRGSMRRGSAGPAGMEGGECSLHSALSNPEWLPELEPSLDEPTD